MSSSEFPEARAAASAPTVVLPAVTKTRCENCGEPLLGGHCYSCGQPTKGLVRHFSSIFGDFVDSVIGLDSRILRTIGPLFLRPGWLSTEYFAGRRVRYVSPVRLFVFLSIVAFFAARMSFDISPDAAPIVVAGPASDAGEAGDGAGDGAGDESAVPDVEAAIEAGIEADLAARAAAADARADAAADAGNDDTRAGADADADASAAADATPAPKPPRSLGRATTIAEVEEVRKEALAAIAEGRKEAEGVPGVGIGLSFAEDEINEQAEARIRAIRHAEETGEPLPMETEVSDDEDGTISFNGEPWDAETNPLTLDWLPDAGNRKLNEAIGRAQQNVRHIEDDPNRLKDALLSTVPTTLFFLLPLFALFLKAAYLFKRRLYMEHLIVALHSHSFLCLSLLLVLLIDALKGWSAGIAFVPGLLQAIEIGVLVWMPLYLLLMQKRVYAQGWIMTILKFCVLGWLYMMLIGFSLVPLLMFSLVTM